MDPPSREPRSSPPLQPFTAIFQARALHFFKKLALRARGNDRKLSRDAVSPVAIPSQDFQRAHSSLDLLRKPDISRLIGFRVEDSPNPMDTDDSSQDASASGNSPRLRHRRHSVWDSLRTAPVHSTFAGRGAAPLFCRHQASLTSDCLVDDSANVLAPASIFLRSNVSVDAVVQPPRSSVSSSEILPQIDVPPASKLDEPAVEDVPSDDTPRPLGDVPFHDAPLTTSSTDPTPSTSSDLDTFSMAQSTHTLEDSTLEAARECSALLPHPSAPLPPPFRVTTERGLRLSPSIITRQPMPLLHLPSLPPAPPAPDSPPRQRIPLRHIPSLSRHGLSNLGSQADHENEAPEDSDEDDGDGDEGNEGEHADALSVHQSDDEDDDSPSAGPSFTRGFRSSQKQRAREDDGSPSASPEHVSPDSPQSGSAGPNLVDLFCSKTYVKSIHFAPSSTSLAMYPFSPSITISEDVNQRRVLNPDAPIPGVRPETKPSLYRVASRSMINLGSTRRADRNLHRLTSRDTVGSNAVSVAETYTDTEESDTEAVLGRLLRRTSMPSFHPTSNPPPYPTFNPYPKENHTALRGDEGRERLPPYSNSLYIIAIMPRKMEFSSPGVQAKDRKWRRVVCELEGTTFRVYKCPPGASGAGVLGDWWEKRVGVGDMTTPNSSRARKKEGPSEMPVKLGIDEPTLAATPPASSAQSTSVAAGTNNRRRRESQSSMATQSTMTSTPRPTKRISGASFLSPFRSSGTTRPEGSGSDALARSNSPELELLPVDVHESRSSLSHESSGRTTPVAARSSQLSQPRLASRLSFLPVATSRAQSRHGEVSKPPESDLMRAYTLQHAESGLGNDYLKRKNVIRVRLEGEQFLLQAPDIPTVVEWIEGLHAGSNIALDIDQRPMPRGPMFPRRRRRRTRRVEGEDSSAGQQQQASATVAT